VADGDDRDALRHRLEHRVARLVDRGGEREDGRPGEDRVEAPVPRADAAVHANALLLRDVVTGDEVQHAAACEPLPEDVEEEPAALALERAAHERDLRERRRLPGARGRQDEAEADEPQPLGRHAVVVAQRLRRVLGLGDHERRGPVDAALEAAGET
jgi:hypothetical protein